MKTGGQVLVDCLRAQGATRIFGVPGESYLAVLDALYDTPEIELIGNRNEGGASFMAAAHGQLTGQPGVCFVTRGPGATNASIGVHTAREGSTPMVLFIGQVSTEMREREAFQEIDYRVFYGPITKWATEIEDVNRIPEIVARAFATAMSGRPGPVVVALPDNILTSLTNAVAGPKVIVPEAAPSVRSVDQITDMLNAAKNPLILLGGGGWNAKGKAAFRRFVETNNLPVSVAFRFQDILDNNSKCFVGDAGLGKFPEVVDMIHDSDLIFAANIRFGECTTDGYELFGLPDMKQKLIHSHGSDRELNKIYTADLPVHAGPNALFEALADVKLTNDLTASTKAKKTVFASTMIIRDQPGGVDMRKVIDFLQNDLPDDAILTNGAGNFSIWGTKFFMYGEDMRMLAPQNGAMGYGLPAAIAAKAEFPDRSVICFAGDGDFQMNCQELGTAMQHGIAPIVLILNNGTYGTIRMHQERTYPARVSFTDIKNPDFSTLAKSYGMHGEQVTETVQFADAFARAKASKTGAILDLVVSAESLTPRQTLTEARAAGKVNKNG